MSVAVIHSGWGRLVFIERSLLCLVILLGLTFTAVLSMGVRLDCNNEQQYLTSDDGSAFLIDKADQLFLVTGKEWRRCQISWQPFVE